MPRGALSREGAPGSKHEPGGESPAGHSLAGSCCLEVHQAHAEGHSLRPHRCTCICTVHLPACMTSGVVYIHVAAHAQQSAPTLLHMQAHQALTCSSTHLLRPHTPVPRDSSGQAYASILMGECTACTDLAASLESVPQLQDCKQRAQGIDLKLVSDALPSDVLSMVQLLSSRCDDQEVDVLRWQQLLKICCTDVLRDVNACTHASPAVEGLTGMARHTAG